MTGQGSSPSETFIGLRNQLFEADLSTLAPAEGETKRGHGPEVYGIVMEGGRPGGSYLVFGLRDGSASLYFSSGGGSIGGQGRREINAAAKAFVATAAGWADKLPPASEHPIPSAGRVRFSILAASGVYAAEVAESDLLAGHSELVPLFSAAQIVISRFRETQQREPPNESSYLNCVLTALARGTETSATLDAGAPLPDPATLTNDKVDREWITDIGFDLGKLSQAAVIELLERMAGFRSLLFWQRERRFRVSLAAHGGESLTKVTFVVRRRRDAHTHHVTISVERSG